MSLTTLRFLEKRLLRSEKGWLQAMLRFGYKDDPEEEGVFTEHEVVMYKWADTWRLQTHQLENELDSLPEARKYRAEHGPEHEDTIYVQEQSPARMVRDYGGIKK